MSRTNGNSTWRFTFRELNPTCNETEVEILCNILWNLPEFFVFSSVKQWLPQFILLIVIKALQCYSTLFRIKSIKKMRQKIQVSCIPDRNFHGTDHGQGMLSYTGGCKTIFIHHDFFLMFWSQFLSSFFRKRFTIVDVNVVERSWTEYFTNANDYSFKFVNPNFSINAIVEGRVCKKKA